MKTISIREALSFGWATFKKRPWFFIGITLILAIGQGIAQGAGDNRGPGGGLVGWIVQVGIMTFVLIGYTKIILLTEDRVASFSLKDLWAPQYFFPMLVVHVLSTIATIVGLVLLIVPGIIIGTALSLSMSLLMDKNMGPIDAMKESWRVTKGRRWPLFLFLLVSGLVTLLGVIALFVGVLVALPVVLLAFGFVYRKLLATDTPVVVVEPTPSAQV